MKNSRVPWSPKAAWASASAASGPEQVSTASASTVTVHEATQGNAGVHPLPAVLDQLDAAVLEAGVGLVVHAVKALHDGLLDLVDDVGPLTRDGSMRWIPS